MEVILGIATLVLMLSVSVFKAVQINNREKLASKK